jgi:putative phosphoribosyl transferase
MPTEELAMADDATEETLTIPTGEFELTGDLVVPADPQGLIVFAHGSGSSRNSARDRLVAETLVDHQMATLRFDLLTPSEVRREPLEEHHGFDLPILADRLGVTTDWIVTRDAVRGLPVGYFAENTGAAAALMAAADRPGLVEAVVARNGRPDLADDILARVRAPALFIVGSADWTVLELNRDALARIPGPNNLEVIPGATDLIERPGLMEDIADLTARWFVRHLGDAPAAPELPPMEGP